jgi:hypothetical protein
MDHIASRFHPDASGRGASNAPIGWSRIWATPKVTNWRCAKSLSLMAVPTADALLSEILGRRVERLGQMWGSG